MMYDFTKGKITGPLIRFSGPVLLAMLLQSLYGAVDLLIVGQFGTAVDVSAVATGSQMMQMVTVLFTGLAMGCTILLGQQLGAGKDQECGDTIGSSIAFFALLTFIVMVIMLGFTQPFVSWMQTPSEAVPGTISYFRICTLGVGFIVAYNVLGSIFRGLGDSKTPLFTVTVACIVNIAGDLLLVGGFHMAAAGAAIATVAAQGVSVLVSLLLIRKRGLPFAFEKENIRLHIAPIRHMMKLGGPIALQDCLVMLSFLVINAIVNHLGLIFSAGVGVAEKLRNFIMLVPSAFSQSLSSFVAQNVGAEEYGRAKQAMKISMLLSIGAGVVLAYIAYFHGGFFSSIFSTDETVIAAAADYLKAYAIDTLLVSFLFCFLGYFNGMGKTTFVMAQGLIGAFLVRIPVSYLMSRQAVPTLFCIGLAAPVSTIVQMVCCILYYALLTQKIKKQP